MRIGLVTDTYTPNINGVVSSIVTLQKELEAMGHDVFVITNHKSMRTKREGNLLRLAGVELKWLYGYTLSTPYHNHAKDEIAAMNLDVMHIHTEFGVGMFGRMCAKQLNIPVVTTYHTMYEDYTHYFNMLDLDEVDKMGKKLIGSLSKQISNHAQAVISPSEKTKETLESYGVKTPIYVIPTGLSLDSFYPREKDEAILQLRQSYGISDDEKLVVFVGRIAPEKSIDMVIDAFQYINDEKIKLMIVGGGPQLEDLKKQAHQLGLDQKIVFTDKVMREEVVNYYACADCFISASTSETQGMTYIEALACGLVVFARYDEVVENLVIEDENGYLCHDAKDFAQKITAFFQKDETYVQQMRQNAREQALKYDAHIFGQKVVSVYHQAISDFNDGYEVIKVKLHDDYVSVTAQNDSEEDPIKVHITLDDYFNYKIRLHMMLDRNTVALLLQKENTMKAYQSAIKKLSHKDYSIHEMRQYLLKEYELDELDCENIMDTLIKKGYLDDKKYMEAKLSSVSYSFIGKHKIIRKFVSKGIDEALIEEVMSQYDDAYEQDKAHHAALKLMKTIKGKSISMKKMTMLRKLMDSGFSRDIASGAIEELDFTNENEEEALNKTLHKAMHLYAKEERNERHYKIIRYCMQKGFAKEDIMNKLEGWNELEE